MGADPSQAKDVWDTLLGSSSKWGLWLMATCAFLAFGRSLHPSRHLKICSTLTSSKLSKNKVNSSPETTKSYNVMEERSLHYTDLNLKITPAKSRGFSRFFPDVKIPIVFTKPTATTLRSLSCKFILYFLNRNIYIIILCMSNIGSENQLTWDSADPRIMQRLF